MQLGREVGVLIAPSAIIAPVCETYYTSILLKLLFLMSAKSTIIC